jgi:hypothetical protein
MRSIKPRRFDPILEEEGLRKYLDEYGFAVVASVIENRERIRIHSGLFWDFLEAIPGTTVRRGEPGSWTNRKDWLPSPGNGIISGFGFGQSEFLWSLRTLPRVRRAFEAIWGGESDLLVSFDGGNCFRPWNDPELQRDLGSHIKEDWMTQSGWWHVDQNPNVASHRGRVCVQGVVTLTAATENTGGLCVVPGSHKHHDAVCERAAREYGSLGGDFVPIVEEDEILRGGALVVCEAGDLVLWDSRTVHCNTPAIDPAPSSPNAAAKREEVGGLLRLAGYVCMTPAKMATAAVLTERREAFTKGFGTSHWPHEFTSRVAPLPGMPDRDLSTAPPEVRRLVVGDGGFCGDGDENNGGDDAAAADQPRRPSCTVS